MSLPLLANKVPVTVSNVVFGCLCMFSDFFPQIVTTLYPLTTSRGQAVLQPTGLAVRPHVKGLKCMSTLLAVVQREAKAS